MPVVIGRRAVHGIQPHPAIWDSAETLDGPCGVMVVQFFAHMLPPPPIWDNAETLDVPCGVMIVLSGYCRDLIFIVKDFDADH